MYLSMSGKSLCSCDNFTKIFNSFHFYFIVKTYMKVLTNENVVCTQKYYNKSIIYLCQINKKEENV